MVTNGHLTVKRCEKKKMQKKKDAKNKKGGMNSFFIKVEEMDEGRIMRPPYIMAVQLKGTYIIIISNYL